MDRPEAYPTMLRRRINELRGGFRRENKARGSGAGLAPPFAAGRERRKKSPSFARIGGWEAEGRPTKAGWRRENQKRLAGRSRVHALAGLRAEGEESAEERFC